MLTTRRFILTLLLIIVAFFTWNYLIVPLRNGAETTRVRPDVIRWIDKHFSADHKQHEAMLRLAESDQLIIYHPSARAPEIAKLEDLAMDCYNVAFENRAGEIDGVPYYEAVSVQTFDTYLRSKKRMAYHHELSGSVFEVKMSPKWVKECEEPFSL